MSLYPYYLDGLFPSLESRYAERHPLPDRSLLQRVIDLVIRLLCDDESR